MEQVLRTLSEPVTGLPIAALGWATVYGIFCTLPGFRTRPFGFVNRAVAIVHALVAVAMVTPLLFLDEDLKVGGPNTPVQLFVLSVSGGFFAYDTIAWIINGFSRNRFDWPQIFHHSAVLTSLACTFHLGRSATDCALGLLIAEVANPFMYMRYLLRAMGLSDSPIGRLNQVVFMLTLTATVPFVAPLLAYYIVTNPNSHLFHQCAVTGLVIVNLYWFALFSQKFMGYDNGVKRPPHVSSNPNLVSVAKGGV